MAKCLVLGANGFIGSHLVDQLAEKGHFIRCFDRYKSEGTVFANLEHHDTEIISGDFLSRTSLEKSVDGMDYVFHFISTTTPISSENDPAIDIETNIRMTVELLKICVDKKVKRVIFASTGGAIYGNVPTDSLIKENVCPKPVSPYAIGKLTIENYLRYFNVKFGLEYQVLRISNPYGPRQNTLSGQGVIPIFLNRILQDEPIMIYGDGSMVRDYVFVEDVAKLISESFDKDTGSDVYNVGSGKGYSVNELVDTISKVTQREFSKEHKDVPSTFVDHIVLDNSKFKEDFGIEPQTTLEEGIKKTWQKIASQ